MYPRCREYPKVQQQTKSTANGERLDEKMQGKAMQMRKRAGFCFPPNADASSHGEIVRMRVLSNEGWGIVASFGISCITGVGAGVVLEWQNVADRVHAPKR
jgi:hypothetical protein